MKRILAGREQNRSLLFAKRLGKNTDEEDQFEYIEMMRI